MNRGLHGLSVAAALVWVMLLGCCTAPSSAEAAPPTEPNTAGAEYTLPAGEGWVTGMVHAGDLWILTNQQKLYRLRDGKAEATPIVVDGAPRDVWRISASGDALLLVVEGADRDNRLFKRSADGTLSAVSLNHEPRFGVRLSDRFLTVGTDTRLRERSGAAEKALTDGRYNELMASPDGKHAVIRHVDTSMLHMWNGTGWTERMAFQGNVLALNTGGDLLLLELRVARKGSPEPKSRLLLLRAGKNKPVELAERHLVAGTFTADGGVAYVEKVAGRLVVRRMALPNK